MNGKVAKRIRKEHIKRTLMESEAGQFILKQLEKTPYRRAKKDYIRSKHETN